MNEWLLVGLMALVTYLPRALPFALADRLTLPAALERGLDFVPIAVLTAIIARTALIQDDVLAISFGNYHAVAGLAAFTTALLTRHLFATIAVGLACFAALRIFLH